MIKHTCKPIKDPSIHTNLFSYKTMLIFARTIIAFYSLQKACQAIQETMENPNVCLNTNMDLWQTTMQRQEANHIAMSMIL